MPKPRFVFPGSALAILSTWLLTVPAPAGHGFKVSPLALEQPGVPHGTVIPMPAWESKIFPGTVREWSVYVPAQYKAGQPAAVMVFQDGHDYVKLQGNWRVPTVFDNLIASGAMPVTIAIFLDPGRDMTAEKPASPWKNSNRSFEYDSLGDRYARFLLEEILPEVSKTYTLTQDAQNRAICGASSGAICAFTVAWERPDAFGKVLSTIGTYTNIRGGNIYPSRLRKTERKPIRVFLEDASGDLDNQFGNWPLANRQMDAALRYAGYDVRFEYAEGYGHNSNHGGSIFPDALQWLWRKDAAPAVTVSKGDLKGDMSLPLLLIDGETWQPLSSGGTGGTGTPMLLGFADGPTSDEAGNFYFSDMKAPGIFKVSPAGERTELSGEGASGLKWGPDGRLYACQGGKKRLIAIEPSTGAVEVIAGGIQPNDLVVTANGDIYFTDTGKKQVILLKAGTWELRVADTGINAPNGIALSPDQATLAVSEYKGDKVWTFRIEPDGSLSAKAPTMTLRTAIEPAGPEVREPVYKAASGGDGMTSDTQGRFYVTSSLGVQVFDPTGRLCGVLPRPQPNKPLTSCALSGPNREFLYVTNGDRIFRRKVRAR